VTWGQTIYLGLVLSALSLSIGMSIGRVSKSIDYAAAICVPAPTP
jgi:H+/Cl- antiporter ClcA